MGKFNSDDHYIYYCGQESLRRNGIALIVNKRVWNVVLGCNLKSDRMISIHFQGRPFNIIVIQVYATTTDDEETEVEWFYKGLQYIIELTPKKDVLFIIGDWNAKIGSQEIPGKTGKFGLGVQNEAGQKLTEFCQENTLFAKKTHTSNNTRDNSTHERHQMASTEIRLIIFFTAKDVETPYSQQKQELKLTLAQIIISLLQNSGSNWRK